MVNSCQLWQKEEGRRKKEEGRGKNEEGRRKKEEGRGKKEERRRKKEEGRRKNEEGEILRCLSFKLFICPNLCFDCYIRCIIGSLKSYETR
ncbi:MAG: hypothetical protein F6K39_32080 [Okeania sp. SIO3B3]|nr:hypothetical protein [Okeania sp. SIO3B3]